MPITTYILTTFMFAVLFTIVLFLSKAEYREFLRGLIAIHKDKDFDIRCSYPDLRTFVRFHKDVLKAGDCVVFYASVGNGKPETLEGEFLGETPEGLFIIKGEGDKIYELHKESLSPVQLFSVNGNLVHYS